MFFNSLGLHVLKCLRPYICTQLCCQGWNFFLGGIQLPPKLANLRIYKKKKKNAMTSKGAKTKAYTHRFKYMHAFMEHVCNAKHINASSIKRVRLPDWSSEAVIEVQVQRWNGRKHKRARAGVHRNKSLLQGQSQYSYTCIWIQL